MSHNIPEATKDIYCGKSEDTVEHSTVTKWFKKFCSGWKNLDNQVISDKHKTVNSEAVLQKIEANPVSSPWRISD